MMGLPEGEKKFKIGLAVSTQYWRVTDGRTDNAQRQRPRYAEPRAFKKRGAQPLV